jgi:hypothetical protein
VSDAGFENNSFLPLDLGSPTFSSTLDERELLYQTRPLLSVRKSLKAL